MSKFLFYLLVFLVVAIKDNSSFAQIKNPVSWKFEYSALANNEAEIRFIASIEDGWHLYSQHLQEGGALPTEFTFQQSAGYSLAGSVEESLGAVESFDSTFGIPVKWFEKTAIFSQRIRLTEPGIEVRGEIMFMVCTHEQCITKTVDFSIPVTLRNFKKSLDTKLGSRKEQTKKQKDTAQLRSSVQVDTLAHAEQKVLIDAGPEPSNEEKTFSENAGQRRLPVRSEAKAGSIEGATLSGVEVFIAGFLGGLAALLMPCIFPMIPFTVGMFSKNSRRGSVMLSLLFGLSIIVIYVAVGLLITLLFGSDALNSISTNAVVNIFFFLLLVVFAASFLGAFEITLPSAWVNRVDAKSGIGRTGIFFAAVTLVLVSFSCTGPIIGTLLVEASASGNIKGPAVGMFGFSAALALPFTLFSMFPGWLKALPKSGGWLNSIKVTLGFLELALALKFLSNVDLAYHWDWFDREVFLVLWIIIFGLLGFYLLGKIKLPHDTPLQHLSVVRVFLAIITLAFTLYLIPGLWGAPLKAVSAFLPPQHTQDFNLSNSSLSREDARRAGGLNVTLSGVEGSRPKYSDIFHSPLGLNAFFDYEEGLAFAAKENKPVIIDFTGHACVNCRKMETTVWAEPDVLETLRNDYVLIQLYVDDKTELPEPEQVVSQFSGRKLLTLGNKWSDFQASTFNTNSQPYYVLLNTQGEILVPPQGADYDADEFLNFLVSGLNAFRSQIN